MIIAKKGVSAVVATVLMILLVMVLGGIIFSWARGFVSAKGEEAEFSSEELCDAIDFDIVAVGESSDVYSFEVVNRGDVEVSALKFRIFPGGNSNIVDSSVILLAGGSSAGSVTITNPVEIERVEALAVLSKTLVGGSSDVVCAKNPVNFDNFFDFYTFP